MSTVNSVEEYTRNRSRLAVCTVPLVQGEEDARKLQEAAASQEIQASLDAETRNWQGLAG